MSGSRFGFTDNQGHSFEVPASSESEAWSLAQIVIAVHDDDYRQHGSRAGNYQEGEGLSDEGREAMSRSSQAVNILFDIYRARLNANMAEGCDPRSGLRGLPHVPHREDMDGVAAMQGGSIVDAQPRQLPGNTTVKDLLPPNTNEAWVYTQGGWRRAEHVKARRLQAERKGNCLVIAAILALVVVCGWAVIYSMM